MTSLDEYIFVRAPHAVIGYHGCEKSVAERLLAGEPFRVSVNEYDWLGSGVYFWEYAPYRAREWAEKRYGTDWCIVQAEIRLGECLNLMDTHYFADLCAAHAAVAELFTSRGKQLPKNRQGANRLDRLVIDGFSNLYARHGGFFDTVRGCFPEGAPLYEGSQLLSHTHVQIAVRNPACIGKLKLVQFE